MSHANAPLSPLGRLRLARFHAQGGVSIRGVAERFQVSTTTVLRWSRRYRAVLASGRTPIAADMVDLSSRPHSSPRQTPTAVERRIVHQRRKGRGPVQIAGRVGVPASTVHRVLVRHGLNRLDHMDRATREVIRFERAEPGDLIHVDIKKLGIIPPGGGWRMHGTRQLPGRRSNENANRASRRSRGTGRLGYAYVHTAIDDRSRLAYSEVLDDETGQTAADFWLRARAFFAAHGITVSEVLTDNGGCYRSKDWAKALGKDVKHRRTRPYRPQTNGKVERFNKTLLGEWAYAKAYRSESARRAALDKWLHIYNHHRPHRSVGGQPPISRVPNVPGQNS